MKFFVDDLFANKKVIINNMKLMRIIAASVMILHDACLVIIGNKPYGKHTDSTHHPFNQNIISVYSDTIISMATFLKLGKMKSVKVLTTRMCWGSKFQKLAAVLQRGMPVAVD